LNAEISKYSFSNFQIFKFSNYLMEISQIIPHIEALVFASDKALSVTEITELINTALGFIEDRADAEQVQAAVEGIREKYDSEFYAFELKQSGGGWQFLTKPAYHKTVALINGDKFIKRLSTAALETLAIIAYKQPITKSEIESIRGVNCDYAVQKLLEKDLVIISGRNEDAVGKPLIYSTSKSFMDYFGINSADELPKISEVFMEEMVKATQINGFGESEEDGKENEEAPAHEEHIIVGETGELHIIADEVPTHIHADEEHAHEAHETEVITEEEQPAAEDAAEGEEIKGKKQEETDAEEES
jgi:segregation and condensation protein B